MDSPTPEPGLPGHSKAPYLTYANVGIAFLFVLFDAIVSLTLDLGLARALLVAAIRCIVQLSVMSLLLHYVFEARSLLAVAGFALLLNLLSAWEVTFNKAKRRYGGMFLTVLASMALSAVPVSAVASRFAMQQSPWWTPDRYVPVLGMILGNASSAVTIASGHTLTQLHGSRDRIEALLAHGANRLEACRPLARESLQLALTPTVNQMSVIGLIALPGMMTGAVLAGQPVDQAAKMQAIIIYIISASSACASLCGVALTCAVMVDSRGRIRGERAWQASQGGRIWETLVGGRTPSAEKGNVGGSGPRRCWRWSRRGEGQVRI